MPGRNGSSVDKYIAAWKALNLVLKYGQSPEITAISPVIQKIEEDYDIKEELQGEEISLGKKK